MVKDANGMEMSSIAVIEMLRDALAWLVEELDTKASFVTLLEGRQLKALQNASYVLDETADF